MDMPFLLSRASSARAREKKSRRGAQVQNRRIRKKKEAKPGTGENGGPRSRREGMGVCQSDVAVLFLSSLFRCALIVCVFFLLCFF